jgi:hypothetical protein
MSFGLYRQAGHPFYARVRDFQRSIIRAALRKHHGNQLAAAAELGLHRNTLARYCNFLGIDPSAFYLKRDRDKYEAQHCWRARKIKEGLCANCFKAMAGGPHGTKTTCGICARKKRERENRSYRIKCMAAHERRQRRQLSIKEQHA